MLGLLIVQSFDYMCNLYYGIFRPSTWTKLFNSNGSWCCFISSAATQDIVIDAYRIELAESEMLETVLASTYNAGYRIGMIVAGGALFCCLFRYTAKGNYIYEAWKYTYLTMAAVMVVEYYYNFMHS